jgi:hypothetical protein
VGEAATTEAPTRRRVGRDLTVLGAVLVLLLAALGAGGVVLYREFYSPTAFVLRYLDLLAEGRAADALGVPGVEVDAAALAAAGLPETSHPALLRHAALSALTDVTVVSEAAEGEQTHVTVAYRAGGAEGRTTFHVQQDGWIGVAPAWRFTTSPLTVINLTVRGAERFEVNGFEVDKRQVSADGVDADPLAPVPLLVFAPGLYDVAVDTAISATDGVAVLADAPLVNVPVDLQAEPTAEFVGVVQQRVEEFLTTCAAQQVLQPTGCPFGYQVRNRVVDVPAWSIVQQPTVSLAPDGAGWRIERTDAVAHIDVRIRSLFDGSIRTVAEDVPFAVEGIIEVRADGSAAIQVSGAELDG